MKNLIMALIWNLPLVTKNQQNLSGKTIYNIKGAGGGVVFDLAKAEIEFPVVSDRGECQLTDAFYWIKNIFPSQSYQIFKS